jgi:[ribosomal protein S5]-alanine N-acetyltransferase
MPTITLHPLDQAAAEVLARDPEAFAKQAGFDIGPHQTFAVAIAEAYAGLLTSTRAELPWIGYLALEAPMRRLVGTCGFKGGPSADNAAEIAYFTFPGEEGRGIATAMADALVRIASTAEHPLETVLAHTLPERNASCRILEKSGFQHTGTVVDPEDGPVWRWELPVR